MAYVTMFFPTEARTVQASPEEINAIVDRLMNASRAGQGCWLLADGGLPFLGQDVYFVPVGTPVYADLRAVHEQDYDS